MYRIVSQYSNFLLTVIIILYDLQFVSYDAFSTVHGHIGSAIMSVNFCPLSNGRHEII